MQGMTWNVSGEMTSTVYIYIENGSCIAILAIVRCAEIDGFLMQNVSNSYEPHSVRMQELEVG